MTTMVMTTISSTNVKPSDPNFLPLRIGFPIRRLFIRLAIHGKHILSAPTGGFGIVLIAAIVAAVWWLANRSPNRDSALVVLRERYARGEISREEYESRRRELAVRVALGAGSRRLTRLLLAESGVLAAIGGSLGIGLALLGIHLVRVNAPPGLPRVAETTLDWAVLAFALATAVAAALLAGILPALQATEIAPAGELKEGSRGATSGRARQSRSRYLRPPRWAPWRWR